MRVRREDQNVDLNWLFIKFNSQLIDYFLSVLEKEKILRYADI